MEKEEKLTMQDNAEEQLFVQIKQMLDEARRQIAPDCKLYYGRGLLVGGEIYCRI